MMTDLATTALEYYESGLYCSQAVIGTFCDKYGMDTDTAFKISCGLNSGCRCSDICGAVSGAILVIGLKYGSEQQVCNAKTEVFVDAFNSRNGDLICRNILGCDISTQEGKQEFINKGLFDSICSNMVVSAV